MTVNEVMIAKVAKHWHYQKWTLASVAVLLTATDPYYQFLDISQADLATQVVWYIPSSMG